MTKIEITLPDQLAQEAERAGLLAPELFEKWLRDQLKSQHIAQLFTAMDRMSAADDPPVLSPEAVAEEIKTMSRRLLSAVKSLFIHVPRRPTPSLPAVSTSPPAPPR